MTAGSFYNRILPGIDWFHLTLQNPSAKSLGHLCTAYLCRILRDPDYYTLLLHFSCAPLSLNVRTTYAATSCCPFRMPRNCETPDGTLWISLAGTPRRPWTPVSLKEAHLPLLGVQPQQPTSPCGSTQQDPRTVSALPVSLPGRRLRAA